MRTTARFTGLAIALLGALVASGLAAAQGPAAAPTPLTGSSSIAVGKALIAYGGCNDCHSPGWNESNGTLPVDKWLLGSNVGFRGPWGVSYPYNLRLLAASMSEDQWVTTLRTFKVHPPMPQANVLSLSTQNQRDIYRFIGSLGPVGEPAPPYAPPGKAVTTQVIDFVPHAP